MGIFLTLSYITDSFSNLFTMYIFSSLKSLPILAALPINLYIGSGPLSIKLFTIVISLSEHLYAQWHSMINRLRKYFHHVLIFIFDIIKKMNPTMQTYIHGFLTRQLYNFLDNYRKVMLCGLYLYHVGFKLSYIYTILIFLK